MEQNKRNTGIVDTHHDNIKVHFVHTKVKGEVEERRQETGDRRQETGDRRQETGDRRQETGDRRQETGDRRQETGDRRPKRSAAADTNNATRKACFDTPKFQKHVMPFWFTISADSVH